MLVDARTLWEQNDRWWKWAAFGYLAAIFLLIYPLFVCFSPREIPGEDWA